MARLNKFNHLSALEHLLKMDTDIFMEALYYPWYVHKKNIQIIAALWLAGLLIFIPLLATTTSLGVGIPLIIGLVATTLFAGGYALLISKGKEAAKQACLKQIMVLEKKQFMKSIEPFVADDQKETAKRISNLVDFSASEYISIAVTAKTRAILHTDTFIKDIERMLSEKSIAASSFKDEGYCDTVFKVPEIAKQNYEKMKNSSTSFSDELRITPQVQAGILAKVREAANRKALGREL